MNDEFARLVGLHLISEDKKHERNKLRDIVLGFLCLVVLLIAASVPIAAHAEPVLMATEKDATIRLWSDPCEITDQIKNLPYKATWEEKGKVYKGCWGGRPDEGIVIGYFDDKTMAVIPLSALKRVQGA